MMGLLAPFLFVGTWVIWMPAAIWLIATGQVVTGVILGGLGGLVATIDNVVRPAILSDRAQMNGLLMFISLLGGVSAFGFLGIVLGPLVSAIVTALFEAYTAPGDLISGSATPTRIEMDSASHPDRRPRQAREWGLSSASRHV